MIEKEILDDCKKHITLMKEFHESVQCAETSMGDDSYNSFAELAQQYMRARPEITEGIYIIFQIALNLNVLIM